jgi:uncharacterized protein (DUF1015 family)
MALLHPFRALRPDPASAARVAAVPYDVVNRDEAAAAARGNPLSFLHVSRAEIDLPPGTEPYAREVYDKAAANFADLRRRAPLVVESEPALYLYRLRMGAHEQTGLAGCYSLDEYDRDLIKKHERTRRDKEDDRTRHLIALSAQTGPVFLTYRASSRVDGIAARVMQLDALVDFDAPDGVRHTIWRVPGTDVPAFVSAFAEIPALYIADGHHRAASAARARHELHAAAVGTARRSNQAGGAASPEAGTFLAVAFPHDQVQILAYNRTVKDLGGLTPDQLIARVGRVATVRDGSPAPARKGEVSMYVGGSWHAVTFPAGRDDLDVTLLQDLVLEPILRIGDVRSDKRIDFVGGARGTEAIERAVNTGAAAVGFSMYPVPVCDLMRIADAGCIMPPKSTCFEP